MGSKRRSRGGANGLRNNRAGDKGRMEVKGTGTEIKMNFLPAVCLRRFWAGTWVREVWEKEGERPSRGE